MLVDSNHPIQNDAAARQRLEQGEIVFFPQCPFSLPDAEAKAFLFEQRLRRIHKNVSLNPDTRRLTGYCRKSAEQETRLWNILETFGTTAHDWLAGFLPRYAAGWSRDRVSFRPEEEATRPLRPHARNDLLHIDSFPTRPTFGARILRLFVNINEHDDRVWVTSSTFAQLLAEFGAEVGLPGRDRWKLPLRSGLWHWLAKAKSSASDYDQFMLRLHHFLKLNDRFQERSRKRYWHFPPHSCWLAFTDGISHAELRGRFALEHSFIVPLSCLQCPESAPVSLIEKRFRIPLSRAG
jgi:hypothetical protein